MLHSLRALLCFFLISSSPVIAISPISTKGNKLYDTNGNQFFVKGLVYVAGPDRLDPLLDTNQCRIDAALMKTLGANTIYIYSIDVEKLDKHSGCMTEFANQGIYVWLQLIGLSPVKDASSPEIYDLTTYETWTSVLDSFAVHDNLLAIGIGQEVINEEANSTLGAPYIKAAARDLKSFQKARGYRQIPISYSTAPVDIFRFRTAQYLSCGSSDTGIDLFAFNFFHNCTATHFDSLRQEFAGYSLPVLISEDGCFAGGKDIRNFAEMEVMLGDTEYQNVFSGLNVYEWAMKDKSGFGLVSYSDERACTGSPTTLGAFNTLKSVWAGVKPTGIRRDEYTVDEVVARMTACPSMDEKVGWLVDGGKALPVVDGVDFGSVTARTSASTLGTGTGTGILPTGTGETGEDAEKVGEGESPGMAVGTAVGITLGIVGGLLMVGLAVFFAIRHRKRKQRGEYGRTESPEGKVELPDQRFAAPEMEGNFHHHHQLASNTDWKFPFQVENQHASEMGAGIAAAELHYELEGSPVVRPHGQL
ncbi:Glucanosyltransferase-domain-containing protein [Podospora fimiseda]|uniref:1,3-beta-glucanosyltransferase n=1 Tax=Podospora fimiseda TaxID=252190 RepID=A0AAN7BMX9_9PEZI|nr:Glucanosyltransferase-domain-containing protein [Podospora fimiseda]